MLGVLQPDDSQDVAVFTEHLDALRFSGPRHEASVVRYLSERYADTPLDVVIALGPQSLDIMRKFGDQIARNVPVVYAGIRESSLQGVVLPPHFTGLVSRFDTVTTVELALALQPAAKELAVVTGTTDFEKLWETRARQELARFEDRLAVRFLAGLPMEELTAAIASMPRDSIIFYIAVIRDGAGRLYVPRDVAGLLSRAANAPIYGVYDTYLGHGIVGGFMDTFESVGSKTSEIARRILNGENPATIDVGASLPHSYIVDWRELQRWGLDESRLPAGTEIRYRSPSLWDQYRDIVVAALAILVLQLALIVALLIERRHRRRVEGTLRESEERYRTVVETQSELICRFRPDTTLTFVNDAYCRYFGRSRAGLIGSRFIDLIPETARAAVLERVRTLTEYARAQSYEHEVLRPDGSLGWQRWGDHPVLDASGRVVEIQAVGRDLTDLHQAEEEVRARREEVTHLTRVAILGELSGALAHELNQPLTAILSNAQAARRLLARNLPDVAEVEAILEDIIADDNRAGEVIQRMRALLKRGSAQLGPLDLNQTAMDVLQLSRSELIERRVTINTSLSPSLPMVLGDRVQLQQVVLNLVLNGCEAMDDLRRSERHLTITTSNGDGLVETTVSDRGVGIEPALLERVFDPFVTTKSGGLGLGLSICRTIVDAHGGRIWARNNPDRGATIGFAIPVNPREAS